MMATHLDEPRLRRLLEVGRGLVEQLDIELVLDRLLETAREMTGARYAALGILDDRRRELERFITRGIDEGAHRAIGDLPRGRGILGLLIQDPKPVRLRDVSDHTRSYGFPVGHPRMETFLGVPVLIRGKAFGNLYLAEKEGGGGFDEADEQAVAILAEWAGIAIENARLYRDVAARRDELERAVSGLEATTTIAQAVGGETRLDRVLELIVKRARALVEAGALLILLEERGELVVAASAGRVPETIQGVRIPIEGTVLGEVFRSRRPERLADISSRLRLPLGELGVRATTALLVPLVFRSQASGVLAAFDRLGTDPRFQDDDQRMMLSFAASAATAVATAKSVESERLRHSLRAAEQERARWARELHDETLQGLGGLRVLISSALRTGQSDAIETASRQAVEQISSEIENLRALISELRPASLDQLGLTDAIESLAARTRSTEGLDVQTRVVLGANGRARLASEYESAIYRLVQEALTNVVKHAEATSVQVEALAEDGVVTVTIRDDGCGFDPASPAEGFGLVGMRERVSLTGGELDIHSSPAGTTICAQIPVRYAGEQEPVAPAARAAGARDSGA